MICPRCKEEVEELVSAYSIFNKATEKGHEVKFGEPICDECAVEVFDEVCKKMEVNPYSKR